jgi:5-methylcytosine-specific restriction enzyme subunit McrC
LHLRERQSRLCRLAPDEVRFLLDHHRPHLHLAPTPDRHVWQLTTGGVVGVILTPRRRIVISAKIPLRNLFFSFAENLDQDHVEPIDGAQVLDLLAEELARLMDERAVAGLHRDYRETIHQGPYLLGSLDLVAQLRQPAGRKEQLHSRHDAFTSELSCNQVPRTLAAQLAGSPLLGSTVRAQLTQALTGFADLSEVTLTPSVLGDLRSPRLPASYRPLCELCLLLADTLAPSQSAGTTPYPALLISLERWFEQYLRKTIVEAFVNSNLVVKSQHTEHVGDPDLIVRPDLTLEQAGQLRIVIDAKWKRLAQTGPESDDLYQMVSYATLLGCDRAVLVYPGRGRSQAFSFARTSLRLWTCKLDVAGSSHRCRQARARLGQTIHRLLRDDNPSHNDGTFV